MDILAYPVFGLYALIIVSGAWLAVTATSLIRAMLGLIASLFGVAGMYLLMAAPLVAFMQILIYVGAIVVLMFFAIMLTQSDDKGDEAAERSDGRRMFAALGMALPAVILSILLIMYAKGKDFTDASTLEVPVKEIGKMLMGPYTLVFELISVVLVIAMAGAVLLTWEKRGKK